jgi:hypothetical protein
MKFYANNLCALAILMLSTQPAWALQVRQLQTQLHEGEYQLTMTAEIAATPAQVMAVLRDYARYPELDARILVAQALTRRDTTHVELLTRINVCVAFFCRKVERVEQVEEQPQGLQAVVIPERSDASRGITITHVDVINTDAGVHTQVQYTTKIVPKFWVPSFLRSAMLRNLREATLNLFTNVERRASQTVDTP